MKRDEHLLDLLLLEVEGEEPKPDLCGYSQQAQADHAALLIEDHLVNGRVLRACLESHFGIPEIEKM